MIVNIPVATGNKLNCFISAREMLSIILPRCSCVVVVVVVVFVYFYMLINHLLKKKSYFTSSEIDDTLCIVYVTFHHLY